MPDRGIAVTQPVPPFSRDEILDELGQLHGLSVAYWDAFSTSAFFAPIGTAWSPADNVRHLTKSMKAVTTGLRLPRMFVRLLFGSHRSESRTFVALRDDYRTVLTRGGGAGRYAPTPLKAGSDPDIDRARIMASHARTVAELQAQSRRWPEESLDRFSLPHPLLGKLSVREMLLFTLYHNAHHLEGVRRRYGDTSGVMTQEIT